MTDHDVCWSFLLVSGTAHTYHCIADVYHEASMNKFRIEGGTHLIFINVCG